MDFFFKTHFLFRNLGGNFLSGEFALVSQLCVCVCVCAHAYFQTANRNVMVCIMCVNGQSLQLIALSVSSPGGRCH